MNIIQPRHERVHALQSGWGFKCTCSHCSLPLSEIDQSDQRIARIRDISNTCEDSWTANDTHCGLDLAIEFVLLHQEEKLTGFPMASAYYQAKMAAEINGLDSLANKYSQLTMAEQVGDDYLQAMRLEEEQAKSQETQYAAEGREQNQRTEEESQDEDRLREELSLGPEGAVINEVGEATIILPI